MYLAPSIVPSPELIRRSYCLSDCLWSGQSARCYLAYEMLSLAIVESGNRIAIVGISMSCSDEVVGIYLLAAAAVTRQRLTLNIDGTWIFDDWQDLGGRWTRINKGRYAVESEGVRCQPEFRGKSRWELRLFSTPLRIARIMGEVLLISEGGFPAFQHAITAPDMTDRLFYLDAGWNVFRKQSLPRVVLCQDVGCFEGNLSLRRRYLVREESLQRLRIVTDSNRLRWFPRKCFVELSG